MKRGLVILLLCSVLLSCRQPAKDVEQQPSTREDVASSAGHVPPNHARILGEIVEVEADLLDPPDVGGPCSIVPCVALVRVESVVGFGMGFPQPFLEGEVYRMKFAYTLELTAGVFPEMQSALPGLREGSRFNADVAGYETLEGDTRPRYTVYRYERH